LRNALTDVLDSGWFEKLSAEFEAKLAEAQDEA
jgi:hypothetical protein